MNHKRLFHRFRPHTTGTFVRWEGDKQIVYVRAGDDVEAGEETTARLAGSIKVDKGAYEKGMTIGIQFGEMTNDDSSWHGGTRYFSRCLGRAPAARQIYTGMICVKDITLAKPRMRLLSLMLMRHHFGDEDALRHLLDWRDGASSRQSEVEVRAWSRSGDEISINIHENVLGMNRSIGKTVRIRESMITIMQTMPETIITAMTGRPVGDVIGHSALDDRRLLIEKAERWGDNVRLTVPAIIGIDDAIAETESAVRFAQQMAKVA